MEASNSQSTGNPWQTLVAAIKIFADNLGIYLKIEVLFLAIAIATILPLTEFIGEPTGEMSALMTVLALAIVLIMFVTQMLAMISMVQATSKRAHGESITLSESIGHTMQRFWTYLRAVLRIGWYIFWPALLAMILLGFALSTFLVGALKGGAASSGNLELATTASTMALGTIFLILVFYRIIKSIFGVYAMMDQELKTGKAALTASLEFTAGRFWRTFGNLAIVWTPIIILQILITFIGTAAQNDNLATGLNFLLQIIAVPITVIFTYLLYRRWQSEASE